MSSNLEETVKNLMADIFGVDPSLIDDHCSRETLEQWDSANHISLIFALETEFGISFEVAEIESMLSLRDVIEILESRA